ncbi:MAG: glycosyltransferase family 1 protein, partial [Patescibacteria group bacterium]
VGKAALLVDPYSVASIRDGLVRLLTDKQMRVDLGRYGPDQAAQYTWRETATAARVALLKVLQRP